MIQSRLSTEKLLVVWCPTLCQQKIAQGSTGLCSSCPDGRWPEWGILPLPPSLASQWLYPALTSDATSPPSWLICSQQALHFPSYLASIPANSNQGYLTDTHSVLTQTNVSSPTSSEALCEMSWFPPSVLAVSQLRTWKVRGLSAYFKKRGRK